MPKFRKKPVIVDAEVYHRGLEDGFSIPEECRKEFGSDLDGCSTQENEGCGRCKLQKPYIKTLEGKHYISEGDYIVTGVRSERYPVRAEIFKETYEAIHPCDYCRYMSTSNDAVCMTCEDFSNFKEV